MVLAHLLLWVKIDFEIAHVNYRLRAEDSDLDEKFVVEWCKLNHVHCNIHRVSANEWTKWEGSIQMKARKIRYDFFKTLTPADSNSKIATAHHLDDQVETTLLNLIRGTGVEGLRGIKVVNRLIIRPLLFARKSQIVNYAKSKGIAWREDTSNRSTRYRRNLVRQEVIPLLEKINPSFSEGMAQFSERMAVAQNHYFKSLKKLEKKAQKVDGQRFCYLRSAFKNNLNGAEELYYLIRRFGFSREVCKSIVLHHHAQSGKTFHSPSHHLLVDRDYFIIKPLDHKSELAWAAELGFAANSIQLPSGQTLHWKMMPSEMEIPKERSFAALDPKLLKWPLEVRRWAPGDRMKPLGMTGEKKISDLLIDLKVDRLRKKDIFVLTSAGEIVWLIGLRISETFKIGPQTQETIWFTCE